MKKLLFILSIFALSIFAFGCGSEEKDLNSIEFKNIEKMCKLSCTEFCFNDTTIVKKTKGEGILHLFDKDMKVFIEYSGKISMGIDFNKVVIDIKNADSKNPTVDITLPKPEVLSRSDVEYKDPIYSEGGFLNNNTITSDEVRKAANDASSEMIESMKNDTYCQSITIDRAKLLIGNYINSFGEAAGRTCTINWTVEE